MIAVGRELPLPSLLRDADGDIPTEEFLWTTSNEKVVGINIAANSLRGLSTGTAIITASLKSDPATKVLIEFSVDESDVVKLIRVDPTAPVLVVGKSQILTAQVHLADGQINGNVTWSSSDDTIAKVNSTTGEVTALKPGKVSILASFALDPKYKGLAEVTIVRTEAERDAIPADPKPSETPVIFGPSATPRPSRTAVPEEESTPAPNRTKPPVVYSGKQIQVKAAATSDSSNGAVVEFERFEIYEGNAEQTSSNGDAIIQRGETELIRVFVKNTGSALTDGVEVELSGSSQIYIYAASPQITVGGNLIYGSLDVGEAKSAIASSNGIEDFTYFSIQVSREAQSGNYDLTLKVRDKYGNSWEQPLSFEVP